MTHTNIILLTSLFIYLFIYVGIIIVKNPWITKINRINPSLSPFKYLRIFDCSPWNTHSAWLRYKIHFMKSIPMFLKWLLTLILETHLITTNRPVGILKLNWFIINYSNNFFIVSVIYLIAKDMKINKRQTYQLLLAAGCFVWQIIYLDKVKDSSSSTQFRKKSKFPQFETWDLVVYSWS